jgi:HlyD family secretion protein
MRRTPTLLAAATLALAGCARGPDKDAVLGTLEWDRIELTADTPAPEPVLEWLVREGDTVAANQPLMKLDSRRIEADVAAQRADLARLEAALSLAHAGPRQEEILEGEARLRRAESVRLNATQEVVRARMMHERKMIADADLDRFEATAKAAVADHDAAKATLAALKNGTRPEDIAQAEAARDSAKAHLAQLEVSLERLTIRAPRAGRVDSLPMKPGDMPARGAVVAVMLAGDRPYARVYVPERVRATVREGDRFRVKVEGYEQPFLARVRHVESQATFTPYFALHGDDASRLTYLAELTLESDAALKLPAGLPVQATPEAAATAGK